MEIVCRLCLNNCDTAIPVFGFDSKLVEQIRMCTSLFISDCDNFPKHICLSCLNQIRDWLNFRENCLKSDEKLKSDGLFNVTLKTDFENLSEIVEIVIDTKNESADALADDYAAHDNPNILSKGDEDDLRNDATEEAETYSHQAKKICNSKSLKKTKSRKLAYTQCCGQTFITKISFRLHIKECHMDEKQYFCDQCGKKGFVSETTLRRHKMLHSNRFECKICFRTFTCQAILRIHERDKHEEDHPYVCDFCGKAFVTELLLNYHQRFHTGERNYVCEVCGGAFVTSSSLAKHKRTHSDVRPHVCDVCGKGFVVRSRLIEHIRMHTGERPFVCDVCDKTYTMQDKLKRHKRIHEGPVLGP